MKKKSFFLVAAFEPSSSTTTGGEKHKSLKNLKEEEKIGMKRQLLHHYLIWVPLDEVEEGERQREFVQQREIESETKKYKDRVKNPQPFVFS